jgi:hypothetical protein
LIIQSATPETRIKIHADNPRGLLYYRDEWSAFINARNKYRGGKGDDLEQDLSEFNGDAIFKDNSNESCFLQNSAISRTGNTQPETLKRILSEQDFEDYTGEFARWLFCLVPAPVAYIDLFTDDGTGQEIQNALIDIYKKVGKLQEQDFFLNHQAKQLFQEYHRFLTDAEVAEEHPGMRATYPKLKSYLARLALWLHIFNHVLADVEPPQIIGDSIMKLSIQMTDFYLSQSKILYGETTGQQLTGDLLKVKQFLERKPEGVTPRDIKQTIFSLKATPTEDLLSILTSLCDLGFCKLDGKKFIYLQKTTNNTNKTPKHLQGNGSSVGATTNAPPTSTNKNKNIENFVGGVGDMLVVDTNAESIDTQESQRFVGDVGGFSKLNKIVDDNLSVTVEENHQNPEEYKGNIFITDTEEFKVGDRIRFKTKVRYVDIKNEAIKLGHFVALKYQTFEVHKVESSNNMITVLIGGQPLELSKNLVEKVFDKPNPPAWKPTPGKTALYGKDLVKVVGFQDGGKEFQIEYPSGFMEFVKAARLKQPEDVPTS